MIDRLKKIPQRESFGLGEAGEKAFELIAGGVNCAGIKKGGKECGVIAIKTIDYNVLGQTEMQPSCGGCDTIIRKRVSKDCKNRGSDPSFGVNGNGRA